MLSKCTVSGIPYPTSSAFRRDMTGTVDHSHHITGRRGSFDRQLPIPITTSGYIGDMPMHQSMITTGAGMNSSMRGVQFDETAVSNMPKRVYQMDMELQKVKLYDIRKRPDSQNFEESNGAMFSNYISHRTSRVVEEYERFKYDERHMNQQMVPGFPSKQRRGSTLCLAQRSGSFTHLNQVTPQRIEESGPVEVIEWFTRDNAREHRTERYEVTHEYRRGLQTPVYRRGQNFFMAMRMASGCSLDLQRTPIFLTFNFGSNPSIGKATKVCLTITGDHEFMQRDKSDWDVRIHHQDGNLLTLQVSISPNAPVGVWSCEVQHGDEIYHCRDDIYILFNPYCSEDPVYLDNEQFRREYVHNESGKIYRGTYRNPKCHKWQYSQFDDIVLPMVTLFLDKYTEGNRDTVDYSQRGNPVFVSRTLAMMIYSKFGILRESENKEDDFSSFYFTGSHSLFEKILMQNFRSVQTDYSYIASAIYVTCCRALGIPCRSITSYRAPQDKSSLNVDMYWSEENEGESDLYQPYQCWNDVWMRREDLISPQSHAGWQAIDPNDKGYGPAPCESIRRGEIGINYDIFHFYALMNSQIRHFYNNTFPEKVVTDDIGRLIVTKRLDRDDESDEFEDISGLYKTIGSEEEKLVVMNAMRGRGQMTRRHSFTLRSNERLNMIGMGRRNEDVMIECGTPNMASFGQAAQMSIMLQNNSSEMRSVFVNLFARPVYHGVVGGKIRHFHRQFTLQGNQREAIMLEVHPQDYQDRVNDDLTIRFYAAVYIKETSQFWGGDEDITFNIPKLNIQTRSTNAQIGNDFPISFSIVNPLNIALTDCYIFYEAPGMIKPVYRRCRDMKPGEMFSMSDILVPRKPGDTKLLVTFHSRQLRNVQGSRMINIRE